MPVTSLNSSVVKWPDRGEVDRAVREWAAAEAVRRPGLLRLGYFGSYARGDWGVGSDVDLVAVVEACSEPFERRALDWDTLSLPVPADLAVYTREEWQRLHREGERFARTLDSEAVWVLSGGSSDAVDRTGSGVRST